MRILIADTRDDRRQRLAAAVQTMRAVSLGPCVSNLSEVYHIAESRPPQAVLVAEDLAQLPEFEVLLTLFKALQIRCVVVADTPASQARFAAQVGDRPGVAVSHIGASAEDLRQCLLQVHLGRPSKPAAPPPSAGAEFQPGRVILIGASTGGVDALIRVLSAFPPNCPPTLIVQHTNGAFSAGLARLLDRHCAATVTEAEDRQALVSGQVLLAPGEANHLELGSAGGLRARLRPGPLQSGHRPSVDALFTSAVSVASQVSAAILTGMGRDGGEGMRALRNGGAATFGQDAATSLVYGMPRAAFELGGVGRQLPLDRIGPALLDSCTRRSAA